MTNKLLEELAEILEEESVNVSDHLNSFNEWDSLTSLSLIAMADSEYGVKITNEDIKNFVTINDIIEFIKKNG